MRLRGCVLCQITRDVDNGSIRARPNGRAAKRNSAALSDIFNTIASTAPSPRRSENQAPAVCARTQDGRVIRLMAEDELAAAAAKFPTSADTWRCTVWLRSVCPSARRESSSSRPPAGLNQRPSASANRKRQELLDQGQRACSTLARGAARTVMQ